MGLARNSAYALRVSRDQRYAKHIIGSWTGALLMIIVVYYGTASLQGSFSCNRLNLKS